MALLGSGLQSSASVMSSSANRLQSAVPGFSPLAAGNSDLSHALEKLPGTFALEDVMC